MALTEQYALYKQRRLDFIDKIRVAHPVVKQGIIVLPANFEDHNVFLQESTFYYFTGLEDAGLVCILGLDGTQKLYVPNCMDERKKWMHADVSLEQENAALLGFDEIIFLGEKCPHYQIHPFSDQKEYSNLLDLAQNTIAGDGKIFSLCPEGDKASFVHQRLFLSRLMQWCHGFKEACIDCSSIVSSMRQQKSSGEIESIFKAISITAEAQIAAARAIGDGVNEAVVQASLEYIMTANNAQKAFPSIVASGPNATTLHYHKNNRVMKKGELVVVDIGAQYKHYAADITRTYPVSGNFTQRQKEIYSIVLETQHYIASIASPGYYLRNQNNQEKSLHHLALAFLKKHGYDRYMPHSIGHYMGLDVHDVGDYTVPLKPGDVFTIEPGIYIPEEEIGIRIEDDYWMTEKGLICLSEDIPKSIDDVESLVKERFE